MRTPRYVYSKVNTNEYTLSKISLRVRDHRQKCTGFCFHHDGNQSSHIGEFS
jgi:hypothetical protein